MRAVQAQSELFLDCTTMNPLIELYEFDSEVVEREAQLAKDSLSTSVNGLSTISDVLKQLLPLKLAFQII